MSIRGNSRTIRRSLCAPGTNFVEKEIFAEFSSAKIIFQNKFDANYARYAKFKGDRKLKSVL